MLTDKPGKSKTKRSSWAKTVPLEVWCRACGNRDQPDDGGPCVICDSWEIDKYYGNKSLDHSY